MPKTQLKAKGGGKKMPENKKGKAGRSANSQKREKNKTRSALAAWRHNAKGKTDILGSYTGAGEHGGPVQDADDL